MKQDQLKYILYKPHTNTLTGNPLFFKTSTTLLPTPPVAPATKTIPEASIDLSGTGSVDDLLEIRLSKICETRKRDVRKLLKGKVNV